MYAAEENEPKYAIGRQRSSSRSSLNSVLVSRRTGLRVARRRVGLVVFSALAASPALAVASPSPAGGVAAAAVVTWADAGRVTVEQNQAAGFDAHPGSGAGSAQGGGIWSQGGPLTILTSTIRNNKAAGGAGSIGISSAPLDGTAGGSGSGGGLFLTGGTATLSGSLLSANSATGGGGGSGSSPVSFSGSGGSGFGLRVPASGQHAGNLDVGREVDLAPFLARDVERQHFRRLGDMVDDPQVPDGGAFARDQPRYEVWNYN